MKTAIYVEDGVTQIVLTPVTAFEREVLTRISREEVVQVRVARGSFHRDSAGWQQFADASENRDEREQCLMLRLSSAGEGSNLTALEGMNSSDYACDAPLQGSVSPRHTFRPRDL